MILTITMNPCIDISYSISKLEIDSVNRVNSVSKTAGGKGLNVARVLTQLDSNVLASGIIGGKTGEMIEELLDQQGTKYQFFNIYQESRNSIAILHDNGLQTEILESGPTLTPTDEQQFLTLYKEQLKKTTLVVISGSLPPGISANFYCQLIDLAQQLKIPCFLDTSRNNLENVLHSNSHPTLIKPNLQELNELLQTKYTVFDEESLTESLYHPIFNNIPWVILSLGKEGALAKYQEKIYRIKIPTVTVNNPVGSGDSTMAGFAFAFVQQKTNEAFLKTGMTTGILNALEVQTGSINPEYFNDIYQQITVIEIKKNNR